MKKLIAMIAISATIVVLAGLTGFHVAENLIRASGMATASISSPTWWRDIEENLGAIAISITLIALVITQFAIESRRPRSWYFRTVGFFFVYLTLSGFLFMLPSLYLTIYRQLLGALVRLNWVRALYMLALVASMLIGIVAKQLWDYTERRPLRNFKTLWRCLHKFGTLRPFIISPIVMISVLEASRNQPANLITLAMAFQNGFFWQTVLGKASLGDRAQDHTSGSSTTTKPT